MMEATEFEEQYECKIQYQYAYDGKKKDYFPIISGLRVSGQQLSLSEFDQYPIIKFHSCSLEDVTIVTSRIRDLNFQNCDVRGLTLNIGQFGGTMGFTSSLVSFDSLQTITSPRIVAIVECEVIGLQNPQVSGFESVHTLAIINSQLDFMNLNPLLNQIALKQLIINDISNRVTIIVDIPQGLHSLKLRNLHLHRLPHFKAGMELRELHLEGIEITTIEDLEDLELLSKLEQIELVNTNISYLPDLDMSALEIIRIDNRIQIPEKMRARLKLAGINLSVV